jgi:hypothetical protein
MNERFIDNLRYHGLLYICDERISTTPASGKIGNFAAEIVDYEQDQDGQREGREGDDIVEVIVLVSGACSKPGLKTVELRLAKDETLV